jgi:hypothetical protein
MAASLKLTFDDRTISMYAHGMSVREIGGHLEEIYGIDVSPDLISAVTDAVLRSQKALSAITSWKEDYNHHRPHSALGNMPPAEFAIKSTLENRPHEARNETLDSPLGRRRLESQVSFDQGGDGGPMSGTPVRTYEQYTTGLSPS